MADLNFIHRFIPAPEPGDLRVLLLLHGTGGDENDMLSVGAEIDPKAALLSPRGKVSENGHARFFRRLAEGVFDEEDVVRRAHELADFVVATAREYRFDHERITAVGYSNGANIATAMMLLRPEVLAAAILLRAMVPLSQPPNANLNGRRVLISAGEHDPIASIDHAQRLSLLLQDRGAEVSLEVQPASHGLVAADLASARRWLR